MRSRLFALLRVRERPDPPPGAGSAPRIFRASRRFLYYSVLMWFPKQMGALVALVASLAFFGSFDQPGGGAEGWERFVGQLGELKIQFGGMVLDPTMLFRLFEILAVFSFLSQMTLSALLVKLSWDLRWYVVGEESMRIREGVWSLREQTMTIASVQNMSVRQGPVQRLFGIADLEIHTAGGGSRSELESGRSPDKKRNFHVGRFRGLENAEELRDSIYTKLMALRGTGLGDETAHLASSPSVGAAEDERVAAARLLLSEARELGELIRSSSPASKATG